MSDSRSDLAKIIRRLSPGDGRHASALPGVHCIKLSESRPRTKQRWRACLCIVAQGCKEIILGGEAYRCGEADYVATPLDLPVTSRLVSATPQAPFLCLMIDFDPRALSEVAAQLDKDSPGDGGNPLRSIFIGKASEAMLDATLRLGKLLQAPGDAAVLGPLVIREILYHLLKGPDGPAIRQFVRSGSKVHKISQAIHSLRSEIDGDVDVESLSKSANMSRSAFFRHFKEMTAMSPIQYQKRLRLLEARRLMADESETAEGSAFRVGYRSASQFSREYSRMFGSPPFRDAVRIGRPGHSLQQM